MAHHDLKAHQDSFALLSLRKSEVQLRKNDRGYAVGDTCIFYEYDPERKIFLGRHTVEIPIVTVLEKHEGLTLGWCLIVLAVPTSNITRFNAAACGSPVLVKGFAE